MDRCLVHEHTPSPSRLEPAIVVFGHSMQLQYANEEARLLLNKCDDHRTAELQKNDLRVEIVKLGARIREQDPPLLGNQSLSQLETQKTVRTTQGSFRLLAFGMPDHSCRTSQQIMIVIEDRQAESCVRYRRGGTNTE
jgi:hypothetical protein